MWARIAASPSKCLLAMTLAFVAGTAAHAFDEGRWAGAAWTAAAALAVLAAVAMRRRGPRLAFAAAALFAAGIVRYDLALPAPATGEVPARGGSSFAGVVAAEPRESIGGTVLEMDHVSFSKDGRDAALGSRMEIRSRAAAPAEVGDVLRWRCRPRPRAAARGEVGAAGWTCAPDAPPERIGKRQGHAVVNALIAVKRRIRAVIGAVLPEPDASLVLGLLIGDTGGIPKDVLAAFRATGTSHVLAVSGYNVHLVVECAFVLLAAVAVGRRRASYVVAALLAAFAVMTGAQAPVIRAAIMGAAGLVAGLAGRRNGGAAPLAIAAAAMLAADPLVLRHDVGFRLSFAAILGLRAFGPPFTRLFRFVPETADLRRTCAETFAATVATMPVALHDFGTLPLAGPLANLAIVPFVPLLSGFGIAALAAGAVYAPFAAPFALPCAVISRAMVRAVKAFAAAFPALPLRASAWEAAVLYAWLGVLWYALSRPRTGPAPTATDSAESVTYAP